MPFKQSEFIRTRFRLPAMEYDDEIHTLFY
jgi:hypothetical protein